MPPECKRPRLAGGVLADSFSWVADEDDQLP